MSFNPRALSPESPHGADLGIAEETVAVRGGEVLSWLGLEAHSLTGWLGISTTNRVRRGG